MCNVKDCELDEYENGKCILHCEKKDWYESENDKKNWEKSENKIKLFWEIIDENIENLNSVDIDIDEIRKMSEEDNKEFHSYLFDRVIFPCSIDNSSPFYAINEHIDFNKDEGLNLNFENCEFLGIINLEYIFKSKNIRFYRCKFDEKISFSRMVFKNDFLFEGCEVQKSISFRNIVFNKICSLIDTKFYQKLDLIHCRFNDTSLMNNITVNNFTIDNSFFRKEVNFIDSKIDVSNRETARIIKDSFEQQNNIIEANKFYAIEMQKREEELKPSKNFFEWLVFKTHGLASNHSQNWLLTLFWIIIFTFIYSFYSYINIMSTKIVDISFFEIYKDVILYEKFIEINELSICIFITFFIGLVIWLITFKFKILNKSIFFIFISCIFYFFYSFITGDWKLFLFSNNVNPFSIVTQNEKISFFELLYRIIIAYLIYQFIISIRQNTRRK
ncbi:hypothetical protein [Arcobacter roscoffensis]|uniref:Pentapeptide repeat-containing protein n=1 Tax=Arcobacter roscoffensis TaxID=2961520 RepID=A0ABY5E8G4_9BACT|nr:hypothetical protein [Arcobacter roscoffensis]UTJ07025.1 hypothetical protein NJU99_02715 [Arcobacter roscoffensis]